jgi:hypothetical protein
MLVHFFIDLDDCDLALNLLLVNLLDVDAVVACAP